MSFATGRSVPPAAPFPRPQESLPTMYDLPSEFPEEPGLPDEFHDLQPQLLSRTLSLVDYSRDNWFTGADLNIYYDPDHPLWHKRPDWFLAVNVPRLYGGEDLRLSYVVWQECQPPSVVIELLSPRTEQEDLGRFYSEQDRVEDDRNTPAVTMSTSPPSKLEVYENYLQVPHYIVYSRYSQRLRYFKWMDEGYQEQSLQAGNSLIWLEDLGVGLGLWSGKFEGVPSCWLRWCDKAGNWLLTDTERAEQKAERLAARLRALGIDPEAV